MNDVKEIENKIYCGDNLEKMQELYNNYGEFVDLIYLDPPFFSVRNYEKNVKTSFDIKKTGFEDIYDGDINTYLHKIKIRVYQMYHILKSTGTLYLHCDWHASHYIKVKILDEIFGYNNFRNEIVWCYSGGGIPKKDYPRKHDIILRYTKSDDYTFNVEYKPYKDGIVPTHSTGEKLNLERGTPVTDWWIDIKIVTPFSAKRDEKIGYPTQKPKALLDRIIKASSNENDIVLDPYCGCGTTLAAAKELDRKFIGIDILPQTCIVMADRIGYPISDIIGLPTTLEDLKKMTHFVFQQWVCDKMCAMNTSKSKNKPSGGDGGIDGIITNSVGKYMDSPIQVTQQENIGVNKIRNFYAAMSEKNKKFGFIIALSFGRGATDKADEYRLEKDIDIKLIKAEDLCNIPHYNYNTGKMKTSPI